MPDKTRTCIECGISFVLTEGDQDFFKEKGYVEPKRCKPCRNIRKQERRSQNSTRVPFEPTTMEEVMAFIGTRVEIKDVDREPVGARVGRGRSRYSSKK